MDEDCKACKELQYGQSLYEFSEDEVAIVLLKYDNIKYCPMCGKTLKKSAWAKWEEEHKE